MRCGSSAMRASGGADGAPSELRFARNVSNRGPCKNLAADLTPAADYHRNALDLRVHRVVVDQDLGQNRVIPGRQPAFERDRKREVLLRAREAGEREATFGIDRAGTAFGRGQLYCERFE